MPKDRREYFKAWTERNRPRINERVRQRYHANLEAGRKASRERHARWAATHRERVNELARQHYHKHREKIQTRQNATSKRRMLKHRYDLTLEAYQTMLAQQGGTCAICQCPPSPNKTLGVDHCHKTQKVRVRGLLCDPCNLALGYLEDNPLLIARIGDYLKTHDC